MRRPCHLRLTYSQFTVYLFITISLIMYYCPVRAQQIVNGKWVNGKYEDVSLSEALLQLSQEQTDYTISFIYNELEDFRITTTVSRKTLPDAIRQMIGFYPVRITEKPDDKEIFVECTHKTDRHLIGTIIDEQGQPIAYANITILNPADSTLITGGVSNESGYFVIPCEQHPVIARVSFVGYKTIYKQCNGTELGTIRMQPDTYTLGNVTVRGERPRYQMSGHGLTVNVQGTMLSEAGTANDVIALLPGVDGNNGNFKVIGKGTPLIYVNGRLLHSTAELDRLSSKDIASIELDTNPGAKYSATVSAVIHIKTVKKAGDGFSGSGRLWAKQGHYGSTSEQVSLNRSVARLQPSLSRTAGQQPVANFRRLLAGASEHVDKKQISHFVFNVGRKLSNFGQPFRRRSL